MQLPVVRAGCAKLWRSSDTEQQPRDLRCAVSSVRRKSGAETCQAHIWAGFTVRTREMAKVCRILCLQRSQLRAISADCLASAVVACAVSLGKGLPVLRTDGNLLNMLLLAEDHPPLFLRGVSEGLAPLQPHTAFLLCSEDRASPEPGPLGSLPVVRGTHFWWAGGHVS